MLSRFALTAFVTIALAVSVLTVEQAYQQRRDTVATTGINSTQGGDVLYYELPASSINTSDARTVYEDFGHLQDLATRDPPPKYRLKVLLDRPADSTQYRGPVKVGDRVYRLAFATTAFNMWVDADVRPQNMGPEGKAPAVGTRISGGGAPVSEDIFGVTVNGKRFRNTVKIDRLEIPNIAFVPIKTASGSGKEVVGDGVIPFPSQEYRVMRTHLPFWLGAREILERKVIAFSHRLNYGEVHIGMIEDIYVGEIEYHPCVISYFWTTNKGKIRVNSRSLGLEDETIVFDTTSRYIRGPAEAVHEIYKSIPGSQELEDGLYGYPCSITPPTITVQLRDGGREWPIDRNLFNNWGTRPNPAPQHGTHAQFHKDELCIGLFAAHTPHTVIRPEGHPDGRPLPVITDKHWRMGHPLLVGKYLVLDWDKRQIGVAELKAIAPFVLHNSGGASHGN